MTTPDENAAAIEQKKKDEEILKLTPEEEAELKTAAARGSYIRELEIHGLKYTVGTASHAANKRWHKDRGVARIQARADLSSGDAKLAPFVTEADVDSVATPSANTAYIATHLRTIDDVAMEYDAARTAVENMESVVQGMLIAEIEGMYQHYKGMLLKLRLSANAKKSSALAKSSSDS